MNNPTKFHTMDLNYYKNLLHSKTNKQSQPNVTIQEYETKYQSLISTYSIAYLQGSDWYIGPSFIKYIQQESIYKIIPSKLKVVCSILDNYN
tara:strand:- start:2679 stop:2954 length:276 start_codon:yes stop_codon:yes gene_type:complete